jgi:hypothetical protein
MRIYARSLQQTSADPNKAQQNLVEVNQVSRIQQNSVKRQFY